jgi:prepilin-type N-terminal cleavage/methylation domain-containing protein
MLRQKGFTLIELLIVIAIIAILAVVVTLTLNPAELLRRSRDSQRISDFATLNRAVSYYLATTASTTLSIGLLGPTDCTTQCYMYVGGGVNCWGRHAGKTTTSKMSRAVDGTGWMPVPLSSAPDGSPISSEPIDPTDVGIYSYSYVCDNNAKTYQFDVSLESTLYGPGGSDDKAANDGGPSTTVYEVGSAPGLTL